MINFQDILIIVVAYNPTEEIKQKFPIEGMQYVVIDNSEEKNEFLDKFLKNKANCEYLPQNNNLGIAKALNIACKYAKEKGYKWVVTMDQDSDFNRDILEKMIDFLNNFENRDKVAVLSPRHLLADKLKVKVPDENREYAEGPYTMSSGNLVNLDLWEKVGGYNEDLFIDMVDVDFYFKLIEEGYKIIVLNKILLKHSLGNLKLINFYIRRIITLNHSPIRKYYQVRNCCYIIKKYKNLKDTTMIRNFLFKLIIITIICENNRIKKIKYMKMGYCDFRHNKFGKLNVE